MSNIDDSSIGLDLIHEKAPILSKDVAFSGSYIEDLQLAFNKDIEFPQSRAKLVEYFEEFVRREKK